MMNGGLSTRTWQSPLAPSELSEGITSVWVSGELVFADGAATDNRPGRVIRRLMQ